MVCQLCWSRIKSTFTVTDESLVHLTYSRTIIIVADVMFCIDNCNLFTPSKMVEFKHVQPFTLMSSCICVLNSSILQQICFVSYNILQFLCIYIAILRRIHRKLKLHYFKSIFINPNISNLQLSFEGVVALQILELNVKKLEIQSKYSGGVHCYIYTFCENDCFLA